MKNVVTFGEVMMRLATPGFQRFVQVREFGVTFAGGEANVAAIGKIDARPVVGYKILGAGRLPAKEAFAFAFQRLRAKDGVCVGIYPPEKEDMLAEDARLTAKLSKGAAEKV